MNKFVKISKLKKNFLLIKYYNETIINIECSELQTKVAVIDKFIDIFEINSINNDSWDALSDRLSEDYYIKSNHIHIFMNNVNKLLVNDKKSKEIFLGILLDTVEWWDGEVEKFVVGGKKKSFNVYLIE